MRAEDILNSAADLIAGPRHSQHGNMHVLHERIAAYWTTYLNNRPDKSLPLSPTDAAFMMALLKMARAQNGNTNPDDFVDFVGYGACAGQLTLHKKTGEHDGRNITEEVQGG